MSKRWLALAALAGLAVSCGAAGSERYGEPSGAPAPGVVATAPTTTATAAVAGNPSAGAPAPTELVADVPDVSVVDVASGKTVKLRTLFPGDRPMVLWFWAPH